MSEWWTYSPSDFLLFAPRTYERLFGLVNVEVWPAHLLTLALGLALWLALLQRRAWAPTAACALLAVLWLAVAWAFHWQRFASFNWAATGYAGAFAIQALLLLGCAVASARSDAGLQRGRARRIGLALLLFALLLQPAVGLLLGRPLPQVEVFGIAPDPTVVATLGVLLLVAPQRSHAIGQVRRPRTPVAWLLWPIPLLWCAVSGATLALMNSPLAWLMAGAAGVAITGAVWRIDNAAGDR